jgi:pimeloyl-ACP methyl ester carboxylesterase
VFIHGLAGCWQNWLENIPHFARGHRVIAMDLPGFGESELPHDGISIPGYGRFIDAFLGEIGVERAAVVGNSMGGFIAAEVAISHPSRVARLALVSAAGVVHVRPTELAVVKRLARFFHYGTARVIARREHWVRRRGMRRMFMYGIAQHPDLLQPELCYEIASGGGKEGFLDAFWAVLDYDFRDRLPEITRPALIVWGRDDRIVPVGGAYEYERLIPGSRRVIFEDTGHVPMIERPAAFNQLLEEFLTE